MHLIIDSHQDLAYNSITFTRDYRRSVEETRRLEASSDTPHLTGQATLGWPEFQRGRVAVIIATLFLLPQRYNKTNWEKQAYRDFAEAGVLYHQQLDFYKRLAGDNPEMFRLVLSRQDLREVLAGWENHLESDTDASHPVGLVLSMEGAEGVPDPRQFERWWEEGLRLVGPVWSGWRLCGGTNEPGGFTSEGYELLNVLADLGYTMDIAHMNDRSAREALDRFNGPVIASHANAHALLKGFEGERHLTDDVIHRLIERDGIMGVLPFNSFLRAEWKSGDDRSLVTLETLTAHIDHVCQMAGDALHVGVGSDFDGGFGYPDIPLEMDNIADLQKLSGVLTAHGYSSEDISAILGGNWRRHLERTLPES